MRNSTPSINLLRLTVIVILLAFSNNLLAQQQRDQKKVFSPLLYDISQLRSSHSIGSKEPTEFFVVVIDSASFIHQLRNAGILIKNVGFYAPAKIFTIETDISIVLDKIYPLSSVTFIDYKRKAKEELLVGDYDLATNKVNTAHTDYPQWNGHGIVISIKENKMDTTDIDLKDRYVSTNHAALNVSNHATIMSTIAAGGGNSLAQGKGAAWGSRISSSDFARLLPEPDATYRQYGISIQNHSYGTGIENFYGADAAAYDMSSVNNPELLHVFSAGNSGTAVAANGPYAGIAGYSNITGSFKMAKNILTVGHIDSNLSVLPLSSRGPAFDGRVKPELVAFGEDGSSGAAALVSGIAAMLQHSYSDQNGNTLPPSSLIRAILINSADDVGPVGLDYTSGYGSVNASKAIQTLVNAEYIGGSAFQGSEATYILNIPPNTKKFRVTLAWNDIAAAPNAPKALVNDLDMELSFPMTGDTWLPWVLNKAAHPDSLAQQAQRKVDTLHTIELITLDDPMEGEYLITIRGSEVTIPFQEFFLTYQVDTANTFKWYFPTSNDNVPSGNTNTVRFQSNYTTTGRLEYTIDNGNTWNVIEDLADLSSGSLKWETPDIFSVAMLRMTIGTDEFVTSPFTISRPLAATVGLNCPDSFLLYWERAPGAESYDVYHLGEFYLENFANVSDTFIVLDKASHPQLHYTIAPVFVSKAGAKSLTFNYTTQGIDCYVKTFFAQLDGSQIELDLQLGSTYRVVRIVWEKLSSTGYIPFMQTTVISGNSYTVRDGSVAKGLNTYRARIILDNGTSVYTQPETVAFFPGSGNYIVFPNPAKQYEQITILNKDAANVHIKIFNAQGAAVFEQKVNDAMVKLPIGLLSKGMYVIWFVKEGQPNETHKLIVY